jgi:hypothetical protein
MANSKPASQELGGSTLCSPREARAMLRYLTGAPLTPEQTRESLDAFAKVGDEWRRMNLVGIGWGGLSEADSAERDQTKAEDK